MDHRRGVAGADAHKHTITFAVLDSTGGEVDVATFDIEPQGMVDLAGWLDGVGVQIDRIGIEGSASWGLPVTQFLVSAGFDVREVNPARTSDRRRRRGRPKTDREDALAVAREVLADPALPPAVSASPVTDAHTEVSLVCERRRSLIRRRQRVLNEAEAVLAKLPLGVRSQLPARGSVLARLRALASADVEGAPHVVEMVAWLSEIHGQAPRRP